MNNVMTRRFFKIVLALLLLSPAAAWTQERPGASSRPDPGQVFAELIKPYRNLNDYTVKISAKILMPTIRIPDFYATLYFKQPDRFHIETKSFAPIPRNSGVFNPRQFDPVKNRITYLKTETLGQTRADVYRVEPLDAKTPVRYYQVWVGGTPGRIIQMENLTFQGTKALVKISHQTVSRGAETWLLPETVRIHLTFPEAATPSDRSTFDTRDNPLSGGMRRLDEVNGEGDIDIAYSDWKVNTGLEDSLFKK
jgi:outer membrane lipoprotein-sorting protein